MQKETLTFLLEKLKAGKLTESEKYELAGFIKKKQNKELITASLEELFSQQKTDKEFDEERFMPLLTAIFRADRISDTDNSTADDNQTFTKRSSVKKGWWG